MAADYIWEMYNNVNAELDQGELERLPEVRSCLQIIFFNNTFAQIFFEFRY